MLRILNLPLPPIDTPVLQTNIKLLNMTEPQLKYAIFHVKWGYFGLFGTEKALLRSCLPAPSPAAAKKLLLKNTTSTKADSNLFPQLQQKITAYFEGTCVDFSDVKLDLSRFAPFAERVLLACRKVRYGHIITYGQLAQMAGSPRSARAVGNILAKNPFPLIIPCHRIIRADGSPGGFTAPSGTKLKQKLIDLEKVPRCPS